MLIFSVKLIVVGDLTYFFGTFFEKIFTIGSPQLRCSSSGFHYHLVSICYHSPKTFSSFPRKIEKKTTFSLGCHSAFEIVSITILLHRSLGMKLKLFLIWIAILEKFSRLMYAKNCEELSPKLWKDFQMSRHRTFGKVEAFCEKIKNFN